MQLAGIALRQGGHLQPPRALSACRSVPAADRQHIAPVSTGMEESLPLGLLRRSRRFFTATVSDHDLQLKQQASDLGRQSATTPAQRR